MTPPLNESAGRIRVVDLLSALSFALDLTEGQRPGHAMRAAVIGMRLAVEAGLSGAQRAALYYALLLKDAGSGTEPQAWEGRAPGVCRDSGRRAARGAAIARRIGLPEETSEAIAAQDEMWDGSGHPAGLRGEEIPLAARILHLAQAVDAAYSVCGADAALEMTLLNTGRRFDPALARAFLRLAASGRLWAEVETGLADAGVREEALEATPESIDRICLAFAEVVDAKSPYTFRHSTGVADLARAMARALDLPPHESRTLWRAALLHDIGKLSVPVAILDKPGRLTAGEWTVIRRHPYFSEEILSRIPGFGPVAEIAGAHHEKLDGSGYFRGHANGCIPRGARILAVADIYDALTARRPYREGLAPDAVLRMIERDVPHVLDAESFAALREVSTFAASNAPSTGGM